MKIFTPHKLTLAFSSFIGSLLFSGHAMAAICGYSAVNEVTGSNTTINVTGSVSNSPSQAYVIDMGTNTIINVASGATFTGNGPGNNYGYFLLMPPTGGCTPTNITNSNLMSGVLNNEGTIIGKGEAIGSYGTRFGTINNGSSIGSAAQIIGTGAHDAIYIGNESVIDKIVNYGTISNTGDYDVIRVQSATSTINLLDNWGQITKAPNFFAAIFNNGTITTLNNLQGGTTPLVHYGNLPTNYNIIIQPSSFGILQGAGVAGALTFGVDSRSTGVTASVYDSVLTDIGYTNIAGASILTDSSVYSVQGFFGGTRGWGLYQATDSSSTTWNLCFEDSCPSYFTFLPIGPSAEDTLASMQPNASAMKNAFNSQYAALAYGLNHDCTIYDTNGVCVSVFGRNTSLNDSSFDSNAAGLVLAYKPHAQFRIGTYIDQSLNSNTTGGVKVERSNPDFGVFGVWNMNADGSGLELRAAANYGKRDINVSRTAIDSAEAGRGKSDLNAYGALLEASYALAMNDSWIANPYAGIRYLSIKRDSYAENLTDDVTAPLTYANLKQETTSAIVGVRFNGRLAPKVIASLNVGLEHDLHHRIDDYRATGVDDLGSINMDNQKDRTRPTAGLGISYDVADKQRVAASVQFRKEIFMSESSTTGQIDYTIGF